MTTDQGYARWDDGYLRPFCYINGLRINLGASAYTKTPQEGSLWALKTHAGTHIVQRAYRGPEAPRERKGFRFTGRMQVNSQDRAEALRAACVHGGPFYFANLDRATDVFDAVIGEAYKLTRPLATSVLASEGVDETSHPTKILLDGVVDPTAASITGQVVTAADTGVLTIHYTPIYRVITLDWAETIEKFNAFDFDFTFEEVVIA